MPWNQTYAPLGSPFASALVAAVPVITLLGLLALAHVRAHLAAAAALLAAHAIATVV
jgi:lactate permease